MEYIDFNIYFISTILLKRIDSIYTYRINTIFNIYVKCKCKCVIYQQQER